MRICCLGSEGLETQVLRLRQGFKDLGHEIVDNYKGADLIYANDPQYYSEDYRKYNKGATIIYCCLDVPPHLLNPQKYDLSRYPVINHNWKRDFNVEELTNKLKQSDIIVTICDEVTWQIKNWCGLEAKTVYNPIKPIYNLNLHPYQKVRNNKGEPYKYLMVGRNLDVNKRGLWVLSILQMLGESHSSIAVVGSEDIRFGDFYGQVNDQILNLFYNSIDYLFLLSGFKSIGLPALEAVCAGKIPIVTTDDPVTSEFFGDIGVPPEPREIANCIKSEEWNQKARKFVDEHCEEYKQKFSPQQICKNILKLIE